MRLFRSEGRDQDGVAAYEDAVLDDGFVLVHAVIVAGDGSGADVDLSPISLSPR